MNSLESSIRMPPPPLIQTQRTKVYQRIHTHSIIHLAMWTNSNEEDLPMFVGLNGTQYWFNPNGEFGRYGDLPAVICSDGTRAWYKNGEIGRDGDLPSVVMADGTQQWYINGKLHRVGGDLPAVIGPDGTRMWYKNGEICRDGDLPSVVMADGTQMWYTNGKLHRAVGGDKPAIIWADGTQEWYINGEKHRDGGNPAYIPSQSATGGRKICLWFQNGRLVNKEEVQEQLHLSIRCANARRMGLLWSTSAFGIPLDLEMEIGLYAR